MMGYLSNILFCISLILTMTNGQETYGDCAPPCKCKWMDGKRGADCSKLNYTNIPNYLSSSVQVFDLADNQIKHLKEGAFYQVGLVNLHKLILRDCKIQDIDDNAFKELKIMIELDLSRNNIRELYPGTFNSTEKLRSLLLNNNYIKTLENNLFHNLLHLQTVDISNNNIDTIADKTFYNLPNFKAFKINSNNLTNLKISTFQHLENLYTLDLDGNPWNCNCHLKDFRDWAIARKLYTAPTTCDEPSYLHGKLWTEIPSDEFACHPHIIKVGPSKNIELVQGERITLWCNGDGIPKPQLTWSHHSKLITNSTTGLNYEKKYIINENNEWSNLTIISVDMNIDRGDYICIATNYGGTDEEKINLSIIGSPNGNRNTLLSYLPWYLGCGVIFLVFVLFLLAFVAWNCQKKRVRQDEKSIEVTSLENHGMGEQEKSLITAVNPVVKPPRRYDAPSSVTSHGTDMTEVNRTLLDNDSVFADGVGSVIGIVGGISEDEGEHACTPEAETISLAHGTNYRHYPPDLLAFSGGRGASPSSQSSMIPEQQMNIGSGTPTRLINHHIDFGSPVSGKYPASFKTLPHNKSSNLSYNTPGSSILPRQGYVTIPRRPRAPSWSSGPPTIGSPIDIIEPVYDNLGLRTTADGSSVLSLNKSPEPTYSMRMRPLPVTPTTTATPTTTNYNTIQRSTPNIICDNNIDRSAPEGAPEWSTKQEDLDIQTVSDTTSTLGRKVPPRPPPKPKKKNNKKVNNGPLYEDEGEDGTEV
ncbi:amphoterin-induced protein 2-like [Aphidius gifuensis]|nr:amphoterin-induced protein 2-like [Aphidius gifuensis]